MTSLTKAPAEEARSSAWATSSLTSCTNTPRRPRRISPNSTSWRMISRAMEVGMAKPMPMLPPERDRMLEGMPTSSPRMFTSAPPELPGLIDASVWMKSSMGLGAPALRARGMDLPRALTMPEVTVCVRPKGLPMAST